MVGGKEEREEMVSQQSVDRREWKGTVGRVRARKKIRVEGDKERKVVGPTLVGSTGVGYTSHSGGIHACHVGKKLMCHCN